MKPIAIVIVLLATASATWLVTRGNNDVVAEQGQDRRIFTVSRRDIGATVLATGVVRPMVGAEVRVGARVSGVLERLYVTVGDEVRQGQLLGQLDSTELHARYMQAQAALENAQAEFAYAADEFRRGVELRDKEIIPETQFAIMERQRDVTSSVVRQAEANLNAARIQLDYTKISAPIGGVVAEVATQVGETVAASFAAPTFVTIIDLDRLEVWAYVDETDIGRVEVGQRATFTVDTYAEIDFEGVVTAVRPMAEIQDAVVNYVTVIEIARGHGKILRPEMTTTVNIELERRENALAIPNNAVRWDADGAYTMVQRDVDRVRRGIRLGYRGREYSEVVEGLEAGDRVIIGTIEQ